jgi:hypothetical protein
MGQRRKRTVKRPVQGEKEGERAQNGTDFLQNRGNL